jgi:hypothetical protein
MKATAVIVVSLLIFGGVGWLLFNDGPSTSTSHSGAAAEQPSTHLPETEVGKEKPVLDVESTSLIESRQRIRDATLALQQAVAARKSAEAELQQTERSVEELESFIETIEARGEDPVDYADEGLAMFQPAFNAYMDAFDRLELAETMEKAAAEELATAEQELERIVTASGDGQ